MSSCVGESDLRRFHAGELDDSNASQVRAHLDECAACKQRDAELIAEHEEFVSQLRGLSLSERRKATHAPAAHGAEATVTQAPAPHGAAATATQAPVAAPEPALAIEGYEILQELYRGGQGVVYKAFQESMKRKVAIKVLLDGAYASASARRRFEREIELVASLKHPNIIAVHDSGVTSDNRPYYLMDYIQGQPLDKYIRRTQLTLEDTLRLFGRVCDALSYAHQRGVIHRDLKPSNILVDAEGSPRVLDFGLAKNLAGPADRVLSVTGQVVGTLPYMSPEQAQGSTGEIDTRTDVYALGVILYELLTGNYPYAVVGRMADILRNIVEAPPAAPSSQWSPESGVSRRKSKWFQSGKCPIDDEIQTIVMRCLAKEQERRYQTAGGLLRDVERYLAGEPIEAKRDSAWYVIRKLAARHVYATVVVVCLAVMITSFGAISFFQYQQVRQALRDKTKSDAVAKQSSIQLAAIGESTHPAVRQMALGWFLLEWRANRLDRAQEIRRQTLATSPERAVMDFLVNNACPLDRLLTTLPEDRASLAYFAAGARHLKEERPAEALDAFERCLALQGDAWLASAAGARVRQLRAGVALGKSTE